MRLLAVRAKGGKGDLRYYNSPLPACRNYVKAGANALRVCEGGCASHERSRGDDAQLRPAINLHFVEKIFRCAIICIGNLLNAKGKKDYAKLRKCFSGYVFKDG